MLNYDQLKDLIKGEEYIFTDLLAAEKTLTSDSMSWDADPKDIEKLVKEVLPTLGKQEAEAARIVLLTTIPNSYPFIKDGLKDIIKDIDYLSLFISFTDKTELLEENKDNITYASFLANPTVMNAAQGSELERIRTYYALLAENKKSTSNPEEVLKSSLASLEQS